MSQVPMEQAPVGQAFTQTPNGAKYFQQQYQQAQQQPESPPQTPPEGQQQPMQVMAPPRGRQQAVMPPPRTYVPDVPPPTQEESVPPMPQTPPALDPQLQQQLEAERQMFAQREQQWREWAQQQQEQLEAGRKAQEELVKWQNREALAQKFANNDTFAGLETVDADDARKILQMSAEVFSEPLQATREQMQQMQTQMRQQQEYLAQQTAAMRSQRARDELLSAHPDFFDLYDNNVAFRQFLNQRDGLSSQTREQRAIAEYNAGNAPYLIDMINQFKGVKPKADDMKTVAPVQVAQSVPNAQPAAPLRYTLADLNYFMQTGQISQDQYRAELNKLRAAQPV